ncbi:uncharacterized protein LOC143220842 [Lasioglossum baleicum]|uniref:uncharacterized protein LOC143220842 n=1 Tax=Lasioglossum baleicum TaxID=434251 RepID=UPI003FCD2AC5
MPIEYEKDPLKRITNICFPMMKLGGIMGLHDIYIRSQCKTALHAAQRLAYCVIPSAAIGFTLPAMTLVAEDLRGKRDPINYYIGAISCLPILKQWLKLPPYMVGNGMFIMAIGVTIFGICEANDGVHTASKTQVRSPRLLVYDQ